MRPPDESKIHIRPGKRDLCKSQFLHFRGFYTVFKTIIERINIEGLFRPSHELFMLFEIKMELSDGMPVSDHFYNFTQLVLHDADNFFCVQDISFQEGRLGKKNRQFNYSACRLRSSVGVLLYEHEASFIKKNAWKFMEWPNRPLGCIS